MYTLQQISYSLPVAGVSLWQEIIRACHYSKKQNKTKKSNLANGISKVAFLIVFTAQQSEACSRVFPFICRRRFHVFLCAGVILMIFLPPVVRLCSVTSSSSAVCCLAKLTNTCTAKKKDLVQEENCFSLLQQDKGP